MSLKVIYEFYKYFKDEERWKKFFIPLNLSVMVYIFTPVLDRWMFYMVSTYLR